MGGGCITVDNLVQQDKVHPSKLTHRVVVTDLWVTHTLVQSRLVWDRQNYVDLNDGQMDRAS